MIPTYDPWVWDIYAEVWVNVETGEIAYPYGMDPYYDDDGWEYVYDEW